MKIKQVITLLLFTLCVYSVKASIAPFRQRQLDSITSSMSPSIRKDLVKAHTYLDQAGKSNEEKIWLFYGYIGTWFKYDQKRKSDFSAPFLNPELTAKKSKGVCRDFARVFEFLCVNSSIPCFHVEGKTKMSINDFINRKSHHISTKVNHEWNIVRVDSTWMLMDPTWTDIETTERIKIIDPKTKLTIQTFVLKSVNRTYYNPAPEFMAITHAPIHPAFTLLSEVPTYKTIRKSESKQKTAIKQYDFTSALNLINEQNRPLFSKEYINESFHYCHYAILYYNFKYELDLALVKQQKADVNYYTVKIAQINDLVSHIQNEFGVDYSANAKETIDTLQKKKRALKKTKNSAKNK